VSEDVELLVSDDRICITAVSSKDLSPELMEDILLASDDRICITAVSSEDLSSELIEDVLKGRIDTVHGEETVSRFDWLTLGEEHLDDDEESVNTEK
jgi:hypothetical protein